MDRLGGAGCNRGATRARRQDGHLTARAIQLCMETKEYKAWALARAGRAAMAGRAGKAHGRGGGAEAELGQILEKLPSASLQNLRNPLL